MPGNYDEDSAEAWIEERTIFVGGFGYSDDDDLWHYFHDFGSILSVDIGSRGWGFVTFSDPDSAEDCLNYDTYHELYNEVEVEIRPCHLPYPLRDNHLLYELVTEGQSASNWLVL